jgi:hypothetical protein
MEDGGLLGSYYVLVQLCLIHSSKYKTRYDKINPSTLVFLDRQRFGTFASYVIDQPQTNLPPTATLGSHSTPTVSGLGGNGRSVLNCAQLPILGSAAKLYDHG